MDKQVNAICRILLALNFDRISTDQIQDQIEVYLLCPIALFILVKLYLVSYI